LNDAAKDNIVQVCKGPLAGKIVRLHGKAGDFLGRRLILASPHFRWFSLLSRDKLRSSIALVVSPRSRGGALGFVAS
jgi:hypothetical protein